MKASPFCRCLAQHCVEDFARILQRCRNRAKAVELHAYMRRNGFDSHPILGNYLIPMLVDAGASIGYVRQAFDRFPHPNEWSWNVLINGYIDCDRPIDALHLYDRMKKGDRSYTRPSGHTYVAALKACAMLRDLKKGEEVHREIAESELPGDNVFVSNSLIDMYAKCGAMAKARRAFDASLVRNVVSYNALIAGYAENGLGMEAMECFESMREEGVLPNPVTYICAVKSCGVVKDPSKGREIHAEAESKGLLETSLLLGTAVVDMYVKCGLPDKAGPVFESLGLRDVVAWTALIAGCVDSGHGRLGMQYFEQMLLEGVRPNTITYVSCLKACASLGDVEKAVKVQDEIERRGIRDLVLETALVDVYCKCGALGRARKVFDKLRARDIVCWNALISGYVEHGHEARAIECLEQMNAEGISPDAVTFICAIRACTGVGDAAKGQEIHDEIERRGDLVALPALGNALIDMYAKCGELAKARGVFDRLHSRDVISWTALMSGYVEHGRGEEAVDCFEQMQMAGIHPNAVAIVCGLRACGSIGAAQKGCEMHEEVERQGLVESDPVVGTALVDMYSKCGEVCKAREVFERLPLRDGVSWTALMAGYAQIGRSEHVFDAYGQMLREGIRPNLVTFVVLLNACSRAHLLDRSRSYLDSMSAEHGIAPALEHQSCLLHLLGKLGLLDQARAMIRDMPFSPDVIVWHSMLGACKESRNPGLAKEAFERSVCFDIVAGC